jgi:methionine-gamma-lyase
MKPFTQLIHGVHRKDQWNSVTEPIYRVDTFAMDKLEDGEAIFTGEKEDCVYTLAGNPTLRLLEEKIALLENAKDCAIAASGIGAFSLVFFTFLQSGDHVV